MYTLSYCNVIEVIPLMSAFDGYGVFLFVETCTFASNEDNGVENALHCLSSETQSKLQYLLQTLALQHQSCWFDSLERFRDEWTS